MRSASLTLLGISCFLIAAGNAPAVFINNPALLVANDGVSWSQLGSPADPISPSFTAVSSNGIGILGNLSGSGTVAKVCPASDCNWAGAPGFNVRDSLLWTEDTNGNGTGPLNIAFAAPVRSVGFYLQLTAPGTFVVSFTEIAGANSGTEHPVSDSAGDPVFIGALDSSADITGISVTTSSCLAGSPGGCNPSDFAIDSLFLADAVPEPATFVSILCGLALLILRSRKRAIVSMIAVTAAAGSVEAQDVAATASQALPIWRYQVASPVNGLSYSGYMVGTSPFNRGARTTTVPVILVPFIVQFTNTTTGFTAAFDPTTAPDAGCTAGQTAMSLVENSPIFQTRDWILNGVDVGTTQYIDAFQRASFWQYVQNTGNAYHTLLSYTAGEPLTLPVSYAAAGPTAGVRVGIRTTCTNPTGSGSTNGGSYQGVVDFNVLRNAMTGYIATHGITPGQFPVFILYNVMYSQNQLLYLGGYHFSEATYPQALTSPGQTYAMANFRTNGTGPFDVSILSHEIAEWVNDPGGFNPAPPWGNIGEVTGCKSGLEVGDPLTMTELPAIAGPNGFAYHLQELAFFSWFFRTPSIGASGQYSDNGSLTSDAGAVCQ